MSERLNVKVETNDDNLITITKETYHALLDSQHFLNCLEAVGVDNWQGYYDAYEMYNAEK